MPVAVFTGSAIEPEGFVGEPTGPKVKDRGWYVTATLKVQPRVAPSEFSAVQMTEVLPRLNLVPDGGEQVTIAPALAAGDG